MSTEGDSMPRRRSVRLVMSLLAAGLALTACGGDEDEPSGAGDSETSASVEPEASDPASAPETSEGELDEDAAASCDELDAVATTISSEFEGGVGIEAGAVLDEQQVQAVTSLVDGFAAVDVSDEELAGLLDELLAAAGTVLDQAETGAELTEADADGFETAFGGVGSFCTTGG